MTRAKHKPPYSFADHQQFNLDDLLGRFKRMYPDHFYPATAGLDMSGKIPATATGWKLATHPRVWEWLSSSFKGEIPALIVAHWLIDQYDYKGASGFLDWLTHNYGTKTIYPYPLATMHLTTWLRGETEKQQNKVSTAAENFTASSDAFTEELWRRFTREFPEYEALNRIPHGVLKKYAAEYFDTPDAPPAKSIEALADNFRQRLKRKRKSVLRQRNSDAPFRGVRIGS